MPLSVCVCVFFWKTAVWDHGGCNYGVLHCCLNLFSNDSDCCWKNQLLNLALWVELLPALWCLKLYLVFLHVKRQSWWSASLKMAYVLFLQRLLYRDSMERRHDPVIPSGGNSFPLLRCCQTTQCCLWSVCAHWVRGRSGWGDAHSAWLPSAALWSSAAVGLFWQWLWCLLTSSSCLKCVDTRT